MAGAGLVPFGCFELLQNNSLGWNVSCGSSALKELDPEFGQLDNRGDVESFSCFLFNFLFKKHYSLICVHMGLEKAVHTP